MEESRNAARVLLPGLSALNLDATLFGGQAFRWRREEGAAVGLVGDRPVRVRLASEGLEVDALDGREDGLAQAAARYFDAGRDYGAAERRLLRDARLREAAPGAAGVRILRQPAFETLVSFVVSANNNIPRISRAVESLARMAGREVAATAGPFFAFPEPAALAALSVEELRRDANLGYRDRYVLETSRAVASGDADLAAFDRLPTPELREALRRLPGVGPKVADCVALFAYGRLEVFPVDTWVRRAYLEVYHPTETLADRQIVALACDRFGPLAGLAQQYLFEAFRSSRRSTQTSTDQSPDP
jgi:N-glycosylase/DNA lyase